LVAHGLKNFKTMTAFFTFIFISRHIYFNIVKTFVKVKLYPLVKDRLF
jgi:hypothetical protein